ncbi:MAG: RNA methyltransferase [Bacteroidales bacterium]|nr:RNA methyltransferase [Bacteroidales bacterium]
MREETVTSARNPKIKNLLLLQEKSKARREQGLFVVEGRRELEHCIAAGFTVRTLFVCPEIAGQAGNDVMSGSCVMPGSDRASVITLPEQLYRKVACRESTEGIIAEVEYKSLKLENLDLPENPLVMVLEAVEKPGNLGAVLRSADAAGAHAVILCDPLTDLYNPNLIRASIGAVFTVPTVACTSADAIAFLQARGIRILTAQLQDSSLYYDVDMRRGTALVMGTESTGLTDVWRRAASAHIRIPMLGRLDSLNVSVSAAILLFEAVRQRQ